MERALKELIDGCHGDAIEAGFWEEARSSAPVADAAALALLGDLSVAVGRLADGERKTGRIDAALVEAVEQPLHLLRRYAATGRIDPYARINHDGAGREATALLPPNGVTGQFLRQLIHLSIEAGETIERLRARGYRPSPGAAEEAADIGIVWLDLCGALPGVVAAFLRKREANRTRGHRYGRAAAKMIEPDEQIVT